MDWIIFVPISLRKKKKNIQFEKLAPIFLYYISYFWLFLNSIVYTSLYTQYATHRNTPVCIQRPFHLFIYFFKFRFNFVVWDSQTFTVYDSAVPNDKDFFFFFKVEMFTFTGKYDTGLLGQWSSSRCQMRGGERHASDWRSAPVLCVCWWKSHGKKKKEKKKKSTFTFFF